MASSGSFIAFQPCKYIACSKQTSTQNLGTCRGGEWAYLVHGWVRWQLVDPARTEEKQHSSALSGSRRSEWVLGRLIHPLRGFGVTYLLQIMHIHYRPISQHWGGRMRRPFPTQVFFFWFWLSNFPFDTSGDFDMAAVSKIISRKFRDALLVAKYFLL